jgi:hypothetical protein
MQMTEERRSETRQVAKECYSAEIRLVGVPVYEVKLKNLSSKGACLLFQNNSSLLNHLLIGQELKVKYFFEDRSLRKADLKGIIWQGCQFYEGW